MNSSALGLFLETLAPGPLAKKRSHLEVTLPSQEFLSQARDDS